MATDAGVIEPAKPRHAAASAPPAAGEALRGAPVGWREATAVLLLIGLADVAIYRGQGFAGYGALFAAAPAVMWFGRPRRGAQQGAWLAAGMLLLLAARLAWLGSWLAVTAGFALLVVWAMLLAGRRPGLLGGTLFLSGLGVAGYQGLAFYAQAARQRLPGLGRAWLLSVVLPALLLFLFASLFVQANPHLAQSFAAWRDQFYRGLVEWTLRWAPNWLELLFCALAGWCAIGLLRPAYQRARLARVRRGAAPQPVPSNTVKAPLYPVVRNTLLALLVLFAAYLVFEFATLWFRDFPEGFYYAGYAHRGAAWLTVALALATVVLSLTFRGEILADPRLLRLRRLAWIWSLENLLLAAAVYNRLAIYVGFNGLTGMRMVGLFGISTVVAGFLLVVVMAARRRSFLWLIQRQMATLAVAVYSFALTPVDAIVQAYNVRRVLAGDLRPAVQISEQPIDAEGALLLLPLAECEHEIIRQGVQARLAERAQAAEAAADAKFGWTAWQLSDRALLQRLNARREIWAPYIDEGERADALQRFHDYVYPWY